MRSFLEAKAMASTLRQALAEEGTAISHSRALELVARQFGQRDWNTLSAAIVAAEEPVAFQRAIPIVRIFSIERAREFYLDYLGFTVDWEHRFEPELPLYMQVHRSGLILHLSEHHGDGSPGSAHFLEMRGIRAFHAELRAKEYGYLRPGLQDEPYGVTMALQDPFGNQLRFCERTG